MKKKTPFQSLISGFLKKPRQVKTSDEEKGGKIEKPIQFELGLDSRDNLRQ